MSLSPFLYLHLTIMYIFCPSIHCIHLLKRTTVSGRNIQISLYFCSSFSPTVGSQYNFTYVLLHFAPLIYTHDGTVFVSEPSLQPPPWTQTSLQTVRILPHSQQEEEESKAVSSELPRGTSLSEIIWFPQTQPFGL